MNEKTEQELRDLVENNQEKSTILEARLELARRAADRERSAFIARAEKEHGQ